MFPLIESDCMKTLNMVIDWGVKNGVFYFQGPNLITAEMARDQNMDKFMELSRILNSKVDEFSNA